MKKLVALVLTLVCALGLVGWLRSNSKNKDEVVSEDLPPILIMREQYFIAYDMPISELPDDFECMGEITEEEANGTGLQGCKY